MSEITVKFASQYSFDQVLEVLKVLKSKGYQLKTSPFNYLLTFEYVFPVPKAKKK